MKVGDTHYRSIWYDDAAREVRIIDQRWLPHEFRIVPLKTAGDFAAAIRDMWVRGAPLIGATAAYGMATAMAPRPVGRSSERNLGPAARHPAHRDQPALGAGRDARAAGPACAGRPRRRRVQQSRRNLRRGCRDQPHDRRPRAADHPRHRRAETRGRPGPHPDPLQRRLAGDGRLGHRDLADLPRGAGGHPGACLRRRNPAAQSGRASDRVGNGRSRRAARPDRRQRRRPPDAAAARSIW